MAFNKIEKIKDADIKKVEQLNNRPNVSGGYGQAKLSAEQLKSWFDSYPKVVREKVDEIIEAFSQPARNGDYIALDSNVGNSLAELVAAITNGNLAKHLTVEKKYNTPVSLENKLAAIIQLIGTKFDKVKRDDGTYEDTIITEQIANEAVTEPKIAGGAVTEGKIGTGAVTTDKILDEAVTESKLAEDVQGKLNAPIKKIDYNTTSGDLEITYNNGGTATLPLPLERLVKSGELVGEDIVLKFDDPNIESLKIPVGTLLTSVSADIETLKGNDIYSITIEEGFNDGDKLLSINKNNGGFAAISLDALVPSSSITESKLSDDVRAGLVTSVSASTDRYFTIKFAKGNAIKIPLSNFILPQSIGTDELKGSAVKTNKIFNEAVTKAKLAPDVISDLNTISKHERRIEQLEGLTLKTIEDSTEAYEKVVPVGVGTTAAINKVGGKVYNKASSNNLCIADGQYDLDAIPKTHDNCLPLNLGELDVGTYHLKFYGNYSAMGLWVVDTGEWLYESNTDFVLRITEKRVVEVTLFSEYYYDFSAIDEYDPDNIAYHCLKGDVTGIMLVKISDGIDYEAVPDTSLAYEPYQAPEIVVVKPKSIESRGANLIPFPYYEGGTGTVKTQNGITFTVREDRGVHIKGKLTAKDAYFVLSKMDFGEKTIGAINAEQATNNVCTISKRLFYNASNKATSINLDASQKDKDIDEIVYPMVNRGATLAPYKPYSAEPIDTYTIPEAIRNREGYGAEGSYIDFDRKMWVDADGNEAPVSADLPSEDFLYIEVEPGGTLKFVNEEGTETPVPSTVTYITKA